MENKIRAKKRDHGKVRGADTESRGLILACLNGALWAAVCGLALALISALICTFVKDPATLACVCGYALSPIPFFVGGYAAARKKRAAIPCGLLCGCVLTLGSVIIGALLPNGHTLISVPLQIILRIALVLACIMGAILGANRDTNKKRRKTYKK